MEVDASTLKDLGKWLLGGIGVLFMGIANLLFKRTDNVDRRINTLDRRIITLETSILLHAESMRRIDDHIAGVRDDVKTMTAAVLDLARRPHPA